MSCHICQLAVQGALGRIIINALHAVLLETIDINKQLGNMVGALTVQAWHHIGDMRQLLWIECAYADLIFRANNLWGLDIKVERILSEVAGALIA